MFYLKAEMSVSDYNVIADIGDTLKKLLWENFETDAAIYPIIIESEDQIALVSPDDMDEGTPRKLSLFLYQIIENGHMKNSEMITVNTAHLQYPPVILDLLFLVTCSTDDRKKDHLLLGKVMQVFHDNAVLKGSVLQGTLAGSGEEFRLVFHTLPFEETINLWQSFREKSFKLSVCYRVTPVKIDSTRQREISRVQERYGTYYHTAVPPEGL
jgi:hypothetical protein